MTAGIARRLRRVADAIERGETPPGTRYVSHDPEMGATPWDQAGDAARDADDALDHYRVLAYDGWHPDIEGVEWGIYIPMERVRLVDRECNWPRDEWVDYALMNVDEPERDVPLEPCEDEDCPLCRGEEAQRDTLVTP